MDRRGAGSRSREFGRLFPCDGFVREVDPGRPATLEHIVLDLLQRCGDRDEPLRLVDHVRRNHSRQALVKAILRAAL